jgi:hypothetical protein
MPRPVNGNHRARPDPQLIKRLREAAKQLRMASVLPRYTIRFRNIGKINQQEAYPFG